MGRVYHLQPKHNAAHIWFLEQVRVVPIPPAKEYPFDEFSKKNNLAKHSLRTMTARWLCNCPIPGTDALTISLDWRGCAIQVFLSVEKVFDKKK